jgi:hypothetical protein
MSQTLNLNGRAGFTTSTFQATHCRVRVTSRLPPGLPPASQPWHASASPHWHANHWWSAGVTRISDLRLRALKFIRVRARQESDSESFQLDLASWMSPQAYGHSPVTQTSLTSANPVAIKLFGINYTYYFCIKLYYFTINPIISF